MRTHTLAFILAVTVLFGAGCGSDSDPGPAATTTTATAPPAAKATGPYGTYVRTVAKKDLQRTAERRSEYGPHQELPPDGDYRLVIAKGSAGDVLKTTDPGDFTIDQEIRLAGDVIRLTSYVDPSRAAYCGPEIAAEAQYRFEVSDGKLTLEPAQDDPCADRDSILTGTWKRL
jgi:hypothetical protein